MGGGAWPFLVGGVICQVNSDNERDLNCVLQPSCVSKAVAITRLTTPSSRKFEAITGL